MKQTMNYLTMAALIVMGIMTISCTELEQTPQTQDNSITTTTTVSLGVDTKALTNGGVKTFAEGDQIAVIFKDQEGTTRKVVSSALPAGSYGNSATFTIAWPKPNYTTSIPKAGSKVRYIYPAAMAANNVAGMDVDAETTINYAALATQDGKLATLAANYDLAVFDGIAPSDANLPASSTLKNQLAICKFTVKKKGSSDDITNCLTKLVIDDGTNTYTMNYLYVLDTIYVAMRPVTSEKTITIRAEDNQSKIYRRYSKTITGKTLSANTIVPISLALTEGVLTGKFSVAAGKQVYFSQGHLRAITKDKGSHWEWMFSHTQYAIDFYNTATINGNGTISNDGEQNVSLFGWSTANTFYGINNSENNNTYSGDFKDWGKLPIVNGGNTADSGWRTLTEQEWHYLFIERTKADEKYGTATYAGTKGLIILPDNYTGPSINFGAYGWNYNNIYESTWEAMEAAGAVFLPTYGYRQGNNIINSSAAGFYWSSTAYDTESSESLKFSENNLNFSNNDITSPRKNGLAVRLVIDAN